MSYKTVFPEPTTKVDNNGKREYDWKTFDDSLRVCLEERAKGKPSLENGASVHGEKEL